MEMLSIASLLFLIILVGAKCLIAHKVHSRAMRTDGNNKHLANLKYTKAWSMTKVKKLWKRLFSCLHTFDYVKGMLCSFPKPSKSVHFGPKLNGLDRGKI